MPKRLIIALALACLPFAALADDSTPAPTPGATPDPAAQLGPQSTSTGAGGSNADGGTLQPAGVTPLQSTNKDATGLTAPNSNALQAPASSDETLKVLAGEADGTPQQTSDTAGASNWGWLWFSLGFAVLAVLIAAAIRYRRKWLRALRALRRRLPDWL
jgi:hypothetical protein